MRRASSRHPAFGLLSARIRRDTAHANYETPSLVAAVVISTLAPAFAITDADIATTFSAALDGTYTNVTLGKFIEGQKPATLTLYTVSGVGHFEVSIQDLFGTNQNGTFTIGAPVVKKAPEINVSELATQLSDGKSKVFIPVRKVGQVSNPVKLVIKNSGTARLTGLGVTLTGADRAKFKVSAPPKLSLAPGESTFLKVTYTATAKAAVSAGLRISSNDKDENPFNLKLQGAVVRLIDDLP